MRCQTFETPPHVPDRPNGEFYVRTARHVIRLCLHSREAAEMWWHNERHQREHHQLTADQEATLTELLAKKFPKPQSEKAA